MHSSKGRIQVKPIKVSTLQKMSKFSFAKMLVVWVKTQSKVEYFLTYGESIIMLK